MSDLKKIESELINDWRERLGSRIKELRKKNNYSQQSLAVACNVTQSLIVRIEKGSNMTINTLFKLSNVLKEDLDIFGLKCLEFESVNKQKPKIRNQIKRSASIGNVKGESNSTASDYK